MQLRKISKNELDKILRKHKRWLNGEDGGERANLSYSDLSYSDLRGSNLMGSNLMGSDLRGSNLMGSNLSSSNLSYSNLSGSDLSGSNLSYSNLMGSNLMGSDLSGSDLSGSNLRGSNSVHLSLACPSHGGFTAWKKCRRDRIVQLFIPADARRLSATTEKCRCDKAHVDKITSIDGTENFGEAVSSHDSSFVYRVGETVSVENFDENRWNECSTGIHFFVDREDAVRYL